MTLPLSTAESLLLRLEQDMNLPSPEAIDSVIHEREDCKNELQKEINTLEDEISERDSKKRALRHAKSLLAANNRKLEAKRWELWHEQKPPTR